MKLEHKLLKVIWIEEGFKTPLNIIEILKNIF